MGGLIPVQILWSHALITAWYPSKHLPTFVDVSQTDFSKHLHLVHGLRGNVEQVFGWWEEGELGVEVWRRGGRGGVSRDNMGEGVRKVRGGQECGGVKPQSGESFPSAALGTPGWNTSQSVVCSIKSESQWWTVWEVSGAEVRWGGKKWCYFPGQIEEVSSPARKSRLRCSDTTDKWEAYHCTGLSHRASRGQCWRLGNKIRKKKTLQDLWPQSTTYAWCSAMSKTTTVYCLRSHPPAPQS